MKAERFDGEKHRAIIDSWCDGWQMSRFPDYWLPATGFIVPETCAAFMYRTDSGVAYIECVISNPQKEHSERNEGMRAVSAAIIEEAKACGFKVLLGLTANHQVANASAEEGYMVSDKKYSILKKDLSL